MNIATKDQILKLSPGDIILVDVEDKFSTIAIFLKYENEKIVVLDTTINGLENKKHFNISEYDKCIIFDNKQIAKSMLSNL